MALFEYQRASDRITAGSWSLTTGVPRTNYPLTALDDGDPAAPLWIAGTSLDVRRNFGAAQRVDVVYIFAHRFTNAAALKLQMNATDAWGGPPTVDISVPVPTAYADGFAYNIRVDVAAAYPTVGDRTKQYLRIANGSANPVSIAIGEIFMSATKRTLQTNVRWAFVQERARLTASQRSKRGVKTVYDYGSIERALRATIPATDTDFDDLIDLEVDAKSNASPIVVVLSPGAAKNRHAEPMLCRIVEPISSAPYDINLISASFVVEELGQGELIGP